MTFSREVEHIHVNISKNPVEMKRAIINLRKETEPKALKELNVNEMNSIRGGGSTKTVDPAEWE